MSLDFYLYAREAEDRPCACDGDVHKVKVRPQLYWRNITHNLGPMFSEAGVYEILWHGDGRVAGSVADRLEEALREMKLEPERFKRHDAPNGWGTYDHAVQFIAEVIDACRQYPEGVIHCSR